ncbi:hypothetical protein pipiens_015043 [Culex pipiens pipiens]|uniref:Uncharacterized protein n=1 Tax=Culex pipiens pipiens TaxID=38569 RepID=A0ABD1CU49_CULPP
MSCTGSAQGVYSKCRQSEFEMKQILNKRRSHHKQEGVDTQVSEPIQISTYTKSKSSAPVKEVPDWTKAASRARAQASARIQLIKLEAEKTWRRRRLELFGEQNETTKKDIEARGVMALEGVEVFAEGDRTQQLPSCFEEPSVMELAKTSAMAGLENDTWTTFGVGVSQGERQPASEKSTPEMPLAGSSQVDTATRSMYEATIHQVQEASEAIEVVRRSDIFHSFCEDFKITPAQNPTKLDASELEGQAARKASHEFSGGSLICTFISIGRWLRYSVAEGTGSVRWQCWTFKEIAGIKSTCGAKALNRNCNHTLSGLKWKKHHTGERVVERAIHRCQVMAPSIEECDSKLDEQSCGTVMVRVVAQVTCRQTARQTGSQKRTADEEDDVSFARVHSMEKALKTNFTSKAQISYVTACLFRIDQKLNEREITVAGPHWINGEEHPEEYRQFQKERIVVSGTTATNHRDWEKATFRIILVEQRVGSVYVNDDGESLSTLEEEEAEQKPDVTEGFFRRTGKEISIGRQQQLRQFAVGRTIAARYSEVFSWRPRRTWFTQVQDELCDLQQDTIVDRRSYGSGSVTVECADTTHGSRTPQPLGLLCEST